MRPSRKITAAFVSVFLIGALAGAFGMWGLTDTQLNRFMSNTTNADTLIARLNKKYVHDYNLNPDEVARIQPQLKEMAQRLSQIRRQFGDDVLVTLDDYHQRIGAQMTPEHREAYEKANAERKKRLSAMFLLDSTPPDPGQK